MYSTKHSKKRQKQSSYSVETPSFFHLRSFGGLFLYRHQTSDFWRAQGRLSRGPRGPRARTTHAKLVAKWAGKFSPTGVAKTFGKNRGQKVGPEVVLSHPPQAQKRVLRRDTRFPARQEGLSLARAAGAVQLNRLWSRGRCTVPRRPFISLKTARRISSWAWPAVSTSGTGAVS